MSRKYFFFSFVSSSLVRLVGFYYPRVVLVKCCRLLQHLKYYFMNQIMLILMGRWGQTKSWQRFRGFLTVLPHLVQIKISYRASWLHIPEKTQRKNQELIKRNKPLFFF